MRDIIFYSGVRITDRLSIEHAGSRLGESQARTAADRRHPIRGLVLLNGEQRQIPYRIVPDADAVVTNRARPRVRRRQAVSPPPSIETGQ